MAKDKPLPRCPRCGKDTAQWTKTSKEKHRMLGITVTQSAHQIVCATCHVKGSAEFYRPMAVKLWKLGFVATDEESELTQAKMESTAYTKH
jgi:hypothetical protein